MNPVPQPRSKQTPLDFPVTQPDHFYAQIIESSARVIAAHATELLLERSPDAHAFGNPAFRGWQDHLAGRLLELAGAMRAGEPALFGSTLHWAKIAFDARGLKAAELDASTDALAEALGESLPQGGTEAIAPYLTAARQGLARPVQATPPAMAGPHGQLAARYMVALLEGDRRAAIDTVRSAVTAGLHQRDALLHVLVPVAREIGRMWHLGEVTIGEEHFATTTAGLTMGMLREHLAAHEPNGRSVLIASVPGNRHELAGRVAGILLEASGWRVIDLGTEMPAGDLVRSVGDFSADLVILGVMLTSQVETANATIAALRADERVGRTPIIVGGHVFDAAPGLWRKMGADGHAKTLGQIVELADAVWKQSRNGAPDHGG